MSYTEVLLIEIRDRTYGQQQTPAAGCRPAFDQAPLRQAMSTRCRIVPATLPQHGTRRTSLKTSVSVSEILFLVPSSFAAHWIRGFIAFLPAREGASASTCGGGGGRLSSRRCGPEPGGVRPGRGRARGASRRCRRSRRPDAR